MKFNPFRPNSMVGPGMFSGRFDELLTIERGLFQTKNENPKHFLVEGERGIGKSSLMFFVELSATGKAKISKDVDLNFIVISLELSEKTTYEDLVKRIFDTFKERVSALHQIKQFAAVAWDFISSWKAFGVEYKKTDRVPDSVILIDELCNGLAKFLKSASETTDGLVILLDEADKPPVDAHIGLFAKLLTERMTKLQCDRVCIGMAGLPTLTQKLRASHESAPRVFEGLYLEPLEAKESEQVVKRGLEQAKKQNNVGTEIDDDALALLVTLSEGYPHFIQQFAYSAFEVDNDNRISIDDVLDGAYKDNGALDQLGNRYFSEMYFERIWSDDYRRVLNAMAEHLDGWVSRSEIIKTSGVKQTQVNNALKALKDRGIIVVDEERAGRYKLPTKSFAVWIKAINRRPVEADAS